MISNRHRAIRHELIGLWRWNHEIYPGTLYLEYTRAKKGLCWFEYIAGNPMPHEGRFHFQFHTWRLALWSPKIVEPWVSSGRMRKVWSKYDQPQI